MKWQATRIFDALLPVSIVAFVLAGCSESSNATLDGAGGNTTQTTDGQNNAMTGGSNNPANTTSPSSVPTGTCRSARLTSYVDNNAQLGCGYTRTTSSIPRLIRDRMYFAMNEPFYGSSYAGPPGEACGECWELTTPTHTAIVIVADLCPIEGNPLCADPKQLHFDLVQEATATTGGGGNDMAAARPVACPVEGNIHLEVIDRSWAYFQAVVYEHRVPLRLVEYQPVGASTWTAMTRRWGQVWDNMDHQDPAFYTSQSGAGTNGVGVHLRLTSAQGQAVTSEVTLSAANSEVGGVVDLGIQFDNLLAVSGEVCRM